jgi:RND family efflux transporter MFP subunit
VPARLALLTENDFRHDGRIDFVDNRVDPSTGTLRARGVFSNPHGVMTPGLFGRLRVPGSEPYRTLLVPELAVQTDQNSKYVLTVDGDNVVRITPVTIGTQFGPLRAISKGLSGDERVIVNGLLRARPGAKVQPQMAPMPGAEAEMLSTTRVVEPHDGPTTAPATRPAATQPAAGAGGGEVGR